jgi:sporulation protein YlmC with PRC-barrel domain
MAAARTVSLELLIGKKVVDADGQPVGRLEEVRARWQGGACLVQEYHLGPAALAERLMAPHRRRPLRVPWEQMDLSDPDHPRLTVRRDQIRRA